MPFESRLQAARLLARRLDAYRGQNPLVLGIPRGAIPMARYIADALEGDLDVVLVHKIGAPFQPEFAIGSVSEHGDVFLSDASRELGVSQDYLKEAVGEELERLRRRRAHYTPVRPPLDPRDRIVIVVDDGTATGWTMKAALRVVRGRHPKRLVAAVGVAPPRALRELETEADEVVCLESPEDFFAVGQFFAEFPQISDEEVIEALHRNGVTAS